MAINTMVKLMLNIIYIIYSCIIGGKAITIFTIISLHCYYHLGIFGLNVGNASTLANARFIENATMINIIEIRIAERLVNIISKSQPVFTNRIIS